MKTQYLTQCKHGNKLEPDVYGRIIPCPWCEQEKPAAPYWETEQGWDTAGNCLKCGEAGRCRCQHKPTAHTPTPWEVHKDDEVYVTDKQGRVILNQVPAFNGRTAEDQAAFIVRAVNSHEELIQAVKMMHAEYCKGCSGDCPDMELIRRSEGRSLR